jgi:hypothetical protein
LTDADKLIVDYTSKVSDKKFTSGLKKGKDADKALNEFAIGYIRTLGKNTTAYVNYAVLDGGMDTDKDGKKLKAKSAAFLNGTPAGSITEQSSGFNIGVSYKF